MSDDLHARAARMDAYQARCEQAAEALVAVLLDPELATYQPHRAALVEALDVLALGTTCGDCLADDCHGADEDDCGCGRHEASVAARERSELLAAAGVIDGRRPPRHDDEGATSWHDLHLYLGKTFVDKDETLLMELAHPAECEHLPAGAVCWAERDLFRDLWPTEPGRYRIRLVDQLLGGDEDGPDYMTVLESEHVGRPDPTDGEA